jgi:hypothetical protein
VPDTAVLYARPSFLEKEFSLIGLVEERYVARGNNTYLGGFAMQTEWQNSSIELSLENIEKHGITSLESTYGPSCAERVFHEIDLMGVKDLDVLVIGSERSHGLK